MKVRVHPGDQRAVGHVRLIWPGTAARDCGVDVEIADHLPILRMPHPSGRALIKPEAIDADVIVLQRPSNAEVIALIPAYQRMGIAVVVDVDDDIACLPTGNRVYGAENHRMILKACALADMVTVTTQPLARRYAAHGRAAVLPNCLPASVLDLPDLDRDGRTVGWGGWTGTHPGDLEATHGGIADAIGRAGARFLVVGPGDDVQRRLGLREAPDATGPLTAVADLEFEQALGQLDVGVVPLADTGFNASKSTLKGIQYAARGVPFIASPLPEYERLATQGAGLLAPNRGRSWRSRTLELLNDPGLRDELAGRGRRLVESRYIVERQAYRWAEAWTSAHEHRQTVGRTAVAA